MEQICKKIFINSPLFLRSAFINLITIADHRKKYGDYFNTYYHYLLNQNSETQKQRALNELEIFLKNIESHPFYAHVSYDVRDFPIINKQIVLNNYKILLHGKPFTYKSTSGTSGQRLIVPYSKEVFQKEYAFWWYHRSYEKIFPGDKVAMLAGHNVVSPKQKKPPYWLMDHTNNHLFFSSYHLSNLTIPSYLKKLNEFKPVLIHGYPSTIYLIARFILDNNVKLEFHPKMIITSSESTFDYQKNSIENAFSCKNYIWYGNTELCGHITECSQGKLHLQDLHSYTRIINSNGKDAQNGEEGKIVSTNFTNTIFPLINYSTCDVVKVSTNQCCSCGNAGKIIDYIIGRIENYIITPEGYWIGRLDHIFKYANHIICAQIEQNTLNEIVIRIVKADFYTTSDENTIIKETRNRIGPRMQINVDYVKEIPREKNGKFAFIVQKLNLNHLALNGERSSHETNTAEF